MSPESKVLFRACSTWFIVTFVHRIKNSTPFCNLTPWTSTTGKGRDNPVSHKVKFSNWFFRIKRVCVSEPVWSKDSKNVIFVVRCLEILKIAVWKKWRHQRIRFLGYTFAKNRYINPKFGIRDVQSWCYNILYSFEKNQILEFKKLFINFSFLILFGFKELFGKIRDSYFK